jgi:hypothetical protein
MVDGRLIEIKMQNRAGRVKIEDRELRGADRGQSAGNRGGPAVRGLERAELARATGIERREAIERPARIERVERVERVERIERIERPEVGRGRR